MNTDALVELIAKRVMEQLQALCSQSAPINPRSSVLVVGDCQDQQLLEQTLGNDYQLSYTCDQENSVGINPEDFDHIVLATLPNSLLSALAIGLERGSEGCVIVESLLLGKTIHILEEGIAYRRYRQKANPAFYRVFADKEATLCSFGMQVVRIDQLAEIFAGGKSTMAVKHDGSHVATDQETVVTMVASQKMHVITNRVVGEKDLRTCYEQGYRRVKLQPRAVITPLARDFLRLKEDLVVTA